MVGQTNNRLIVHDLTLRIWVPPFSIALAGLGTVYHYNANAPGKLGQMGLLRGDCQGGIIRLFGPNSTTGLGTPISAWVETGWMHLGAPEYRKLIRAMTVYGKTLGSAITLKVFVDGDTANSTAYTFGELDNLADKLFAQEQNLQNVAGRFFNFRIECTDVIDMFGLQIGASVIREWGAM